MRLISLREGVEKLAGRRLKRTEHGFEVPWAKFSLKSLPLPASCHLPHSAYLAFLIRKMSRYHGIARKTCCGTWHMLATLLVWSLSCKLILFCFITHQKGICNSLFLVISQLRRSEVLFENCFIADLGIILYVLSSLLLLPFRVP